MAQIGSPSAGWYTDPSGQHRARYWDGAAWTEQVRDDLSETAGPSTGPAPVPAPAPSATNPVADTVAGVAEAVAAVAANDLTRPATTDVEPAFVVDYGTDTPWGGVVGSNGNGSGPAADPFAPVVDPFAPAADPFGAGPGAAGFPEIGIVDVAVAPGPGVELPTAAAASAAPVVPVTPVVPVAETPVAPVAPVTSGPAAGWYPDPAGRHQARLWDGTRWTERVADHGVEGLDPLPGAPASTAGAVSTATGTVDPTVGAWSSELMDAAGPSGADVQPLSAGQISLASLPDVDLPDAAVERAQTRPSVKVKVAGGCVLGGAIALLVGSAMTWMDVTGPKVGDHWTASGLDLGDGRITVALALVLAVLGAGIITGRMGRIGGTKVAAMGSLVAGAAALAVTAVDIADVADRASRLGVPAGAVSNVGSGLWIAFLGALFAVGGGLMAFANRR